jgi:GNAT superfamily N-acetyltransferase
MKILVLNGSPKVKSDTFRLTDAFLKGLNRGGVHEVRVVHVREKQIAPCRGCFGCWQQGDGHCDQEHPVAKKYACITLRERPELLQPASAWFHEKWGVPQEAYQECMTAYLNRETEYGWYLCLDGGNLIGGLGIIQNDFHDRKDLAPNVCAVYTEEAYRGQGIAERLLNLAVEDMRAKGISPLYLVTDHIGFYERYGWEFLCMAHEDDSGNETRVYIHR